MKKTLINIYGSKLRQEIERRGLSLATVSRELGFADGFIANCITRNLISQPAANLIYVLYHIPLDEYKIPDPEEKGLEAEEPEKQEPEGLDYEKLQKIIYKAVADAIKDAQNQEDKA